MIDWNKPLKTKSGLDAVLIEGNAGYEYTRAVLIFSGDHDVLNFYTESGKVMHRHPQQDWDIVNEQEQNKIL